MRFAAYLIIQLIKPLCLSCTTKSGFNTTESALVLGNYAVTGKDFGLSRKCASAGTSTNAPTMFQMNMNPSKMPMSAWNLIGDSTQVRTAMPSVIPVITTTFPVESRAR
ncbi:hypothetical protein D9M73_275790 [compost metagenome]